MTPLRQRMIEDMQLRGLAPQTQKAYVNAVRRLAGHYGKSPAEISEEELRQYFLYLTNEKEASRSTCTVTLCAIKFLYNHTLQRDWPTLQLVRPPTARPARLLPKRPCWTVSPSPPARPMATHLPPIMRVADSTASAMLAALA